MNIKVKIWLDDLRPVPDDTWTAVRWPEEVIELLKTKPVVVEVSLDFDLGEEGPKARTGYSVLEWIEQQVFTNGFEPPVIHIHSDNAAGVQRMQAAVKKIKRLGKENEEQGR